MKWFARSSTLALFSMLALTGAAALAEGGPKVGQPAPAFTLKDQNGKDVSLSDFGGKVVVLEWFNDGCPFVRKHYDGGNMNAVAAKYKAQDVVWLAVNSTFAADAAHNKAAAEKYKIDRPILNDAAGKVGHAYAATNTPQMFVIGKDGKIAYEGAIDSKPDADAASLADATNHVAKALDEVLAGKPVTTPETEPYGCTVKYEDAKK